MISLYFEYIAENKSNKQRWNRIIFGYLADALGHNGI